MDETTNPVQPAKSRMTLYIIIGVVVLALLAFFGRGSFMPSYVAPGVSVDRDMDGSTTYTNNEGSVTVGQGTKLPDNWPSDAPKPLAGATIIYSGSSNPTTGQPGSAISYTVNASVKAVADYYSAQLPASGWTIESNADAAGMHVVSAKKDARVFGAYIADAGNGTTNVTVGIQM